MSDDDDPGEELETGAARASERASERKLLEQRTTTTATSTSKSEELATSFEFKSKAYGCNTIMAMASSQASSSRRQGAILDMASAGPSGLPAITGPTDQLQQIQKKLQALVASTGQLQFELAHAPTLDW